MSNPLTTAREAVWDYLYAETTAASTALKNYIDNNEGKVYRYASGSATDDMPARLTAGDSPVLVVLPAAAPPVPDGELLHELRFGLEVRGAVVGTDPGEIEDFFWLVHRAIHSGYPSLGDSAVRLFYFDSVTFSGLGAQRGSPWFWTFTARLVVHLRLDPQA